MTHLLRPRLLTAVCTLAVLAAAFATACGTSTDSADSSQIAQIGDRVLTRTQLDALLPDGDATVPSHRNTVITTWLLTQAIEREVIDRGYPIEEADISQANEIVTATGNSIDDFETELLRNTFALSIAVGRWAEKELEAVDPLDPPLYLCSNHILFDTGDEAGAEAALARALDGEDFAELAMELSIGPTAAAGGDLSCGVAGRLVPEFEETAYAADAGDIVGPVMTEFGWHIIQIESVGPATAEFHPNADRQPIDILAFELRETQTRAVIFDLEQVARGNFGDSVVLDPSIGTFDAARFEIISPE